MNLPTLSTLSDQRIISDLITDSLYSQLGIQNNSVLHQELITSLSEEDYESLLAHVQYSKGRGTGTYTVVGAGKGFNWDLGKFIHKVSIDIAGTVYKKGEELSLLHFKKPKPTQTKISQDVIDTVWLDISKLIGDKVGEAYDKGNLAIPGLEEAVNTSAIFPHFGQIMAGPNRSAELAHVRQYLQSNLPVSNDVERLYAQSRNALFAYWQKNFGLFVQQ